MNPDIAHETMLSSSHGGRGVPTAFGEPDAGEDAPPILG